jgi:hypothetical protein
MPDARRFTLVWNVTLFIALLTLLCSVLEAAKVGRTPTPSVSARTHERLARPRQQVPGALQSAETTPAQPARVDAAPSASGTFVLLGVAGALAVLVFLVVLVRKQFGKARTERERLVAEYAADDEVKRQAALKEFEALSQWSDQRNWPNLNREATGVILGESEKCVALSRGVQHIQLRKSTHYEGRSAGVSFRIMKGVSIRSGRFAGRPVTTVSTEVADAGTILVTDKRVVFAGGHEVVEVPLRKLADVRSTVGTLQLLVANRANPLEFKLAEAYRAPVIAAAVKLMAGVAQAGHRRTSET